MIKKIFLLQSLLLLVNLSNAQDFEWAISVPIESHENLFLPIKAMSCSEDKVFACGPKEHPTLSTGAYDDLLLLSYDYSGQLLDSTLYDGEAICTELIYHDQHLYILGYYKGSLIFDQDHFVTALNGFESVFLAKTDLNGTVEWVKNFDEGFDPLINDMAISDAGIIFLNEQYGLQGASRLVQIDSEGVEINSWIQDISFATDIVYDPMGYIYLYGGSLSGDEMIFNGTTITNPNEITRFIAKYDLDGELVYAKTFEDIDISISRLLPADNGEVFLAMKPGGEEEVDGFQFTDGHWVLATSIIRLNASGEILWVRDIGIEEQEELGDGGMELYHGLAPRADDGIYIGGVMRQYIDWGGGFVTDYDGGSGFIWGLNSSGTTDMVLTDDGGFSVSKMELATANEVDYFSFVTLTQTLTIGGLNLPADNDELKKSALVKWSSTVSNLDESHQLQDLLVYPNPALDEIRIGGIYPGAEVIIIDAMGRELIQMASMSTDVTIDLRSLCAGRYFIRVLAEDGVWPTKSFLKMYN